jgi:hypothetical protein
LTGLPRRLDSPYVFVSEEGIKDFKSALMFMGAAP